VTKERESRGFHLGAAWHWNCFAHRPAVASQKLLRETGAMATKVQLICTEGELAGKEFVFEGPRAYTIGRAETCDLAIPAKTGCPIVSRHHCLLAVEPDPHRIIVFDCGSRNGTFVNDRAIGLRGAQSPATGYTDLKGGDHLRLGNEAFRVEIIEDEPATPAGCESTEALCPCI
jgi:pSer/pThr/pTyr-binding forkhead associated (FHA) protein